MRANPVRTIVERRPLPLRRAGKLAMAALLAVSTPAPAQDAAARRPVRAPTDYKIAVGGPNVAFILSADAELYLCSSSVGAGIYTSCTRPFQLPKVNALDEPVTYFISATGTFAHVVSSYGVYYACAAEETVNGTGVICSVPKQLP
jgi:hypothetical protein